MTLVEGRIVTTVDNSMGSWAFASEFGASALNIEWIHVFAITELHSEIHVFAITELHSEIHVFVITALHSEIHVFAITELQSEVHVFATTGLHSAIQHLFVAPCPSLTIACQFSSACHSCGR